MTDPSRLPGPEAKPPISLNDYYNTVFDVAERYLVEQVKEEVRHGVTKKILDELEADIQAAVDKAISEITFHLEHQKDPLSQKSQLTVLVEWVKCRQQKRQYRERRIVEEVTNA